MAPKQLPSLLLSPLRAVGLLTLCTPAGTNEQAVIDVLTKRTNAQRQQIAKSFKAQFGKVKGDRGLSMGRGALGALLRPETPGRQLRSGQGPRLEASF